MSDFDTQAFKSTLGDRASEINDCLPTLLPDAPGLTARCREAMHYSLMAGGKRVRPMLCVLGCEAVGGDDVARAAALRIGCAWEFIHTYSLIHDDLPAMDDDDTRRGQPTCHKQFDEATAVLAGDALLTHAFEVVATHAPTPELARDLVILLAQHAGVPGMVGGQMADVLSEGAEVNFDHLRFIHNRKTMALIKSAVLAGAMIGGADQPTRDAIARYGEAIGLAFQVADDILDVVADPAELGKTTGKDEATGKLTYVAAMGLDAAREEAKRLLDDALAALEAPGLRDTAILADLARFIVHRTH